MNDYGPLSTSQEDRIRAIVEESEPPTPAVWGIFPVETENYPVPEDMKDWG